MNWEIFFAAFFACIPATIAAVAGLIASLHTRREAKETRKEVNGKFTMLLKHTYDDGVAGRPQQEGKQQ
jgi:hypothetical protein